LSLIHWYKKGVAGELGAGLLLLLLVETGPAAAVAGTEATVRAGVFSSVLIVFSVHLMCSSRPQERVARRKPQVISRSKGQPRGWGLNIRVAKTRTTATDTLRATPKEMATDDRGPVIIMDGDAMVANGLLRLWLTQVFRDKCSALGGKQIGVNGGISPDLRESALYVLLRPGCWQHQFRKQFLLEMAVTSMT
jgi:hypothetical protein